MKYLVLLILFLVENQSAVLINPYIFSRSLVFSELGTLSTTTGAASYATTAAYTPSPNALVLATVIQVDVGSPVDPVYSFSGNGLTWVEVAHTNFNTLSAQTCRAIVFRAMGSSPTTTTGTATFGSSMAGCIIQVVQFANANTSGSNGSGAIAQTNNKGADATANPNISYTASSGQGVNMYYWIYGDSVNSTTDSAPPSGWTEIRELSFTTPASGGTFMRKTSDATTSATTTATARNWGGIIVEIKP